VKANLHLCGTGRYCRVIVGCEAQSLIVPETRHGDTAGIYGDTVGIPEAPLRYPHPVVGHASVGARASCPLIPSHSCVHR